MTEADAIKVLKIHSYCHDDVDEAKAEKGFVGMLKPFTGELYENNFHEVMQAIQVLKPVLKGNLIGRDIIASLWTICHCGRFWGVEEGGVLRRNKLMTDKQVVQLTDWVETISIEVMLILEGSV
jgi:hypothetical protein